MAKNWALLALTLVLLTGCQQTRPTIAHLPPPSFAGPNIAPRAAAPAPSVRPPAIAAATGPRDWKPSAPARPWKWIVIHHSASPAGSMMVFDREHKAKGWDGVGYHFVIGNGTNTSDGQVEVTPRWPIQKWGAHAKTADNRFNEYGIGICLVGNFELDRPTSAQMHSLARLVGYLMQTYHIPASSVVGHRDTKATQCPGKFVNIAAVRQMAQASSQTGLAASSATVDSAQANIDLLHDIPTQP